MIYFTILFSSCKTIFSGFKSRCVISWECKYSTADEISVMTLIASVSVTPQQFSGRFKIYKIKNHNHFITLIKFIFNIMYVEKWLGLNTTFLKSPLLQYSMQRIGRFSSPFGNLNGKHSVFTIFGCLRRFIISTSLAHLFRCIDVNCE